MIDILIPVGGRVDDVNDELKIALRSIDKHTNVGRVFIITTGSIPWLTNVNIVKVGDPYNNNKDKNLIHKIVETLKHNPDINDFVFWSDDQVITKDIKLEELPKVYNDRGLEYFRSLDNKTKWQRRVCNTLEVLDLINYDVSCNWEAHTPEVFNSKKILDGIDNIDWKGSAGNYTICTLFAYLCDYKKEDGIEQNKIKYTYEHENPSVKFDKLYIGYNDVGFKNGLREELFKEFDTPSKYENVLKIDEKCKHTNIGVFARNINADNLNKFLHIIKDINIVFTLDESSYNSIKRTDKLVYYIPIDTNIFKVFKTAVNLSKYLVKYCVVIDGNSTYEDSYINDNITNLIDGASLCITDALRSFNSMLFDPIAVSVCIENIDNVLNVNNLGAFLLDKGVRPAVIVNNAT